MSDEVLSERKGSLRIITLNRPERHNATDDPMSALFQQLLSQGAEAVAMGLANYCVAHAALDAKVGELAAAMLGNSRHSNAENKRLVYDTDGMALDTGLSHELMRNAGFDPPTRKKGEPISGAGEKG